MENKIIGVDRMVLTRRKVTVLLLSLVFLLSMAQVSMASGVVIPTNTTKDTSYESFFIYPGESYSFTNTGEEEAGILLGSDGVASYVIEYYDENGNYLFEDAYFMDGYGGPGMLPKEKVIVSVEANSPNPLNIDNYSTSLEIEKLTSEEQSTPPVDVEDPKPEQEQEQEQGTSLTEPASPWAQPEIDKAKEIGLLTTNTSMFFTTNITRGQFAELVVNMVEKTLDKEIESAPENTFADTNETSILKAYNANIVNGITETEFEPKSLITREQIATMLYRAIEYIETENGSEFTTKNETIEAYQDRQEVSSWAKSGVGILANNGIMKGTSDTTLSPKGNATVEQCVILVYRLYNLAN